MKGNASSTTYAKNGESDDKKQKVHLQLYEQKAIVMDLISYITSEAWRSMLPLEGNEDGGLLSSKIGSSAAIWMNCLIHSTNTL